jgi:ribose transport system permease protein
MTTVPQASSSIRRPARIAINAGLAIFVALYAAIALLQPNYLEPGLFMNFLRRAAPLVILACGQLYVILTGGFDLSMGAVATLVVLAASILINGDPDTTWAVIGALYVMGIAVGLVNGLVVAFLKVPSIITTLGTMLLVNGLALAWSGGAARNFSAVAALSGARSSGRSASSRSSPCSISWACRRRCATAFRG